MCLPCSDRGELYSLLIPLVVGRTWAAERCDHRESTVFLSTQKGRGRWRGRSVADGTHCDVRESSSAPMLWACTHHTCGSRKAPEQSLGGQSRVAPLSLRVCCLSPAQQWCESLPKEAVTPGHSNQGALAGHPQRNTDPRQEGYTLVCV